MNQIVLNCGNFSLPAHKQWSELIWTEIHCTRCQYLNTKWMYTRSWTTESSKKNRSENNIDQDVPGTTLFM